MSSTQARCLRYRQLPIWRDAVRLLVAVESAVRQFLRFHKYTLGADLRRQAMVVFQRVANAAQHIGALQRNRQIGQLVWVSKTSKSHCNWPKRSRRLPPSSSFRAWLATLSALHFDTCRPAQGMTAGVGNLTTCMGHRVQASGWVRPTPSGGTVARLTQASDLIEGTVS